MVNVLDEIACFHFISFEHIRFMHVYYQILLSFFEKIMIIIFSIVPSG